MKEHKFNLHTFLTIVSVLLVLGGLGAFFGLLMSTNGGFEGIFTGLAIAVCCFAASFFISKKNKYYCSKCGTKMMRTGNAEETGDYETVEDGRRNVVLQRMKVEYYCPQCKNTKIIEEKFKVGSYK